MTVVTLFEPWAHGVFDEDESVLWHELAHATTWYGHGHAVGRLRLTRTEGGLLEGGAQLAARDPNVAPSPEYFEKFAERQLAAESAVRRLHGLPRNRICISVNGIVPQHTVAQIQRLLHLPGESDISRALDVADLVAHGSWYRWLKRRLESAVGVVDRNWEALGKLADHFRGLLPSQSGESMIVWGCDLLYAFSEAGVTSGVPPAIEVVARGDQGDLAVRARRDELHRVMGSSYRIEG
jgi:hypothetical protein